LGAGVAALSPDVDEDDSDLEVPSPLEGFESADAAFLGFFWSVE
jgi:hypothetical protein